MNLIRLSIERPIAAMVLMICFLVMSPCSGSRSRWRSMSASVIIVKTNQPGAAPQEIEREIINPQEDELKGLEGVKKMESGAP